MPSILLLLLLLLLLVLLLLLLLLLLFNKEYFPSIARSTTPRIVANQSTT